MPKRRKAQKGSGKKRSFAQFITWLMVIHGDLFDEWWHTRGSTAFYKYAKKKGAKYFEPE